MEQRGIIIVFASKKGGPGKSTLSVNTAVEIARRGASVVLVDADSQRTTAKFMQRREALIEAGQPLYEIACFEKLGRIKKSLIELSRSYDVVIADTAGRDSEEMRSAFYAADLILIPTEASQPDIESLEETANILEETFEGNEQRIVRTIINKVPTHYSSSDDREAKEFIKAEFGEQMPPLKQVIRYRKAYKKAMEPGLGVIEENNDKAKAEIQCLVNEIEKLTDNISAAEELV